MSITTNFYYATEETTLVEVYVNGTSVGICEESQIFTLVEKANK